MTCPRWLYRWLDERGSIPRWVRWLFPKAHWCPEMDDLLVIGDDRDHDNCFCGHANMTTPPDPSNPSDSNPAAAVAYVIAAVLAALVWAVAVWG